MLLNHENLKRKILPYNPRLKLVARNLRNNSTLAEIILWNGLKQKKMMGYDFHRQKPIDNFVVDFFCPELLLAIEIDGDSHDGKIKNDEERQTLIERFGVEFLRFDDHDVKNHFECVVMTIEDWIKKREKKNTHPSIPSHFGASRRCRGDCWVKYPQKSR